jgi:hypothetical protein
VNGSTDGPQQEKFFSEVLAVREEKARELLKRAEALGFRLNYDCGFVTIARPADELPTSGLAEMEEAIIRQLAGYMAEVHLLVLNRARLTRARRFIGRAVITSPTEFGTGTGAITSCNDSGVLQVSQPGKTEGQTFSAGCRAEDLFVLVEEPAAEPAPIAACEPSERPSFLSRISGGRLG